MENTRNITYLIFGFALFIIISHCGQYCSVRKCFIKQLWQTGIEKEKNAQILYFMIFPTILHYAKSNFEYIPISFLLAGVVCGLKPKTANICLPNHIINAMCFKIYDFGRGGCTYLQWTEENVQQHRKHIIMLRSRSGEAWNWNIA